MTIIEKKKDVGAFLGRLRKRAGGVSKDIKSTTASILAGVRRGGDKALIRYTKRFDGHEKLRLSPRAMERHARRADPEVLNALSLAARRIRKFHARQKEASWSYSAGGARLGQIIRPLRRVGVYVPGGSAAYPSTVLMNVIPAQVAGVPEIAVTVPTPGGEVNPSVMAALGLLGIREVYTVGGAQAIGALAYGTSTIRKVDKIVGPGNIYVATAKRMVFGEVDIDMVAGPSEILVIADATARADFIASDLLSQAEHDPLASSVLVTDSPALAQAVKDELKAQLPALARKDAARKSLRRYGAIIVVKDIEAAAALSNTVAPEHLEIMTARPRDVLPLIENAGAVFLGPWSPEPLGDYMAGPNHTLPTGGTSRWASPLGVYDFIKRTSLIEFTRKGFISLAGATGKIAVAEGLGAHASSISIRLKKNPK